MMTPFAGFMSYGFLGMPFLGIPFLAFFALPLLVWSLIWKGLALWKAARRGETYWFVALLIVNTLGILEILYLYVFSKDDHTSGPSTPSSPVAK